MNDPGVRTTTPHGCTKERPVTSIFNQKPSKHVLTASETADDEQPLILLYEILSTFVLVG